MRISDWSSDVCSSDLVKVTGITVPAGGSATIVFDATIQGSADPGDIITNTATVANGSGPGATPSVQTQVAASQAPVSGNKLLDFEGGGGLDRTQQAGSSTIVLAETGRTTFPPRGWVARDRVRGDGLNRGSARVPPPPGNT